MCWWPGVRPRTATRRPERVRELQTIHVQDLLGDHAAPVEGYRGGIYNVEEILSVLQNNHRIEPETALKLFHVAEFELWHDVHRS